MPARISALACQYSLLFPSKNIVKRRYR